MPPHAEQARPRVRRLATLFGVVLVVVFAELLIRLITLSMYHVPLFRHPQLQQRIARSREVMPALTLRMAYSQPEQFPAIMEVTSNDPTAPKFDRYSFGHIPIEAFDGPPPGPPRPGKIRIIVAGGSTSLSGYVDLTEKLLQKQFGQDNVEIINLAVMAGNSATSVVLLEKFVPIWQPHLIVTYHGFNDISFNRARATIRYLLAMDSPLMKNEAFPPVPSSRGIVDLIEAKLQPGFYEISHDVDRQFDVPSEAIDSYWRLSRIAWKNGAKLVVSTFARPDYSQMPPDDYEYYDLSLAYLWPLIGSVNHYRRDLDIYNAELRYFAQQAGVQLVDIANSFPVPPSPRVWFRDNCHRTLSGNRRHAQVLADALTPTLHEMFAKGVVPPVKREDEPFTPIQATGEPTAAATLDGQCHQGPCPQGMCFVPAGTLSFGVDIAAMERTVVNIQAARHFGNLEWFEDDGPPVNLETSAFCIDRYEASEASHQACIAADACPDYHSEWESELDRQPAVLPTFTDAVAYCHWRGARLPTDVEWEMAARGGQSRPMPWGTTWTGSEANYCGAECVYGASSAPHDSWERSAPIFKAGAPSPIGAVGMAGNLWEWVDDCLQMGIHKWIAPGTKDPTTRPSPSCRAFMRGGGYYSYPGLLERRTAEGVVDITPDLRGVRCVTDFGIKHTAVSPPADYAGDREL